MDGAAPIEVIVSLLAPPRCGICAAGCRAREPLCEACARSLGAMRSGRATVAGVGPVSWAADYEGAARALVAALKFGRRLSLAPVAAAAIVASLPAELGRPTVVPVPAAPLRRRRRGFDPAEAIAERVATALGLPMRFALTRRDGRRQVGRPRRERIASPPRVRPAAAGPAPIRVLLIDDVLTTGATASACASALRGAGCVELRAAVFARTLGGRLGGA